MSEEVTAPVALPNHLTGSHKVSLFDVNATQVQKTLVTPDRGQYNCIAVNQEPLRYSSTARPAAGAITGEPTAPA